MNVESAQPTAPAPGNEPWHTLLPEEAFARLGSTREGLYAREAEHRLAAHGPNQLAATHRPSALALLAEQFKNVLIVILLVATALSAFLGHGVEAVAITVIVLFAVILGFVQEWRAERAMEALQRMAAPMATVLRDGAEAEVPARDVVPGDVLVLRAGDRVPADARLFDVVSLQAEEAALTGESTPVEKSTAVLEGEALALGDRRNMVFAGTAVSYGHGRALVVATGMQTEFGKIARLLETVETTRTPLQQNLDRLGTVLARVSIALVAVIVALGLMRAEPFIEMLVFGIALAVAVVPEALPAVVTISLALGVQRLVRRNALMRRLPAVETLGSTSVICSDKTGTLTKDEMTVRRIFAAGAWYDVSGVGYAPRGDVVDAAGRQARGGVIEETLRAAVLASDARIVRDEDGGTWRVQGDPTEGALIAAAGKIGLGAADLESHFPRVAEIPFCSETKCMTTLHTTVEGVVACTKGAPEVVLAACSRYRTSGAAPALTDDLRREWLTAAQHMADDALRVLAVASRTDATLENAQSDLTLLGLVGMIDPPRDEARAAIDTCRGAGIRVVMITGDHPATARAIARELGLSRNGRVVTGVDLEGMSDATLDAEVETIDVYARVTPAHKLRVVTALQSRGHVVAMTGDGVNDAPALKRADIGVAMGITGTDVAKEAAAMTLVDDNFASIVAAVEEGRGIFGNIKKYLMFLLSSNIGEIGLMAGTMLMGLPLPLSAVQILYVNLATDGLPALALSVDPPEPDLMRQAPRDPRKGIFSRPVVALMTLGGVWSTFANIGLFAWALDSGRPVAEAMTMTFVSLVTIQFLKAYSFRSDHLSVFARPFANRWLNLAIAWELFMLLVVVYLPVLHAPFGTFALTAVDWAIVSCVSATVVPVLEIGKWVLRRAGHTA